MTKPCHCVVKQQDDGRWRCFMCWREFVPLDAIVEAPPQLSIEEIEKGESNE